MNKKYNLALSLFLAACSNLADASGPDYKCKIERISSAEGDSGTTYDFNKFYLGEEFTIDRQSGVMVGILKNSYVTQPEVIDYGSTGNSYKVIAAMRKDQGAGAGSNIYALTVNEYESAPKKPFVFLRNDEVFFGYCEHY